MKIWVDADACPREARGILLRASRRLKLPIIFVSNHELGLANNDLVQIRIVSPKADEADRAIARDVEPGDLVVTADIPLAADVVERGAEAIDHRGEHFSEDDVRTRLSMRNFLEGMRGAGTITGGPTEYGNVDKQRFAATLDRLLTKLVRAANKREP